MIKELLGVIFFLLCAWSIFNLDPDKKYNILDPFDISEPYSHWE